MTKLSCIVKLSRAGGSTHNKLKQVGVVNEMR